MIDPDLSASGYVEAMTIQATFQSGSQSVDIGTFGAGLTRFSFWIGVRTPQSGSGLQVRLDTVDSLGFLSSTPSGNVDGSAPGSTQGYWTAQCDGVNPQLCVIDSLGAPGLEYDYEYDIKQI